MISGLSIKKKIFMPFSERKEIIENLIMVDMVLGFDDDDQGAVLMHF